MRYSKYFEEIGRLHQYDKTEAERILRDAEFYASQYIQNHLILCAKSWKHWFNNEDNAMRCLLESECRTNDCRGFIEIAFAHLDILQNMDLAQRNLKKAMNLAVDPEDFMRLEEVFLEFGETELANFCHEKYTNIIGKEEYF